MVKGVLSSRRGSRPDLPSRVKVVAALQILLALLFALRLFVASNAYVTGLVAIFGFAGVGILRNSGWARTIAIVILWIVAFFLGLSLATSLIASTFGDRRSIEGGVRALIKALGFWILVEALSIWMLRVLIDRKIDPLFDPRRWKNLQDRSEAFE